MSHSCVFWWRLTIGSSWLTLEEGIYDENFSAWPEKQRVRKKLKTKKYYWGDEHDQMTTPWLWIGISIFGQVSKEKISWPSQCMPKLCELSWIRPEYEAINNPLTCTHCLFSASLYCLGLGSRYLRHTVCHKHVVLMTSDRWFPDLLERHEMETFRWCLCEHCSYDIEDWSVLKAIYWESE